MNKKISNPHRLFIFEWWFLESVKKKLLNSSDEKFYSNLNSCLGTAVEKIKINSYIIEINNLIQLLVSVMSHCSQTFSVDFLEFLWKRRQYKNLKKSANKFIKTRNSIYLWKSNNCFYSWETLTYSRLSALKEPTISFESQKFLLETPRLS